MRSADEVAAVLRLRDAGHSALRISRLTGLPRSTVRGWVDGRSPRALRGAAGSCPSCNQEVHRYTELPEAYVYLLGLYLGDGCMSEHRRKVWRLRIVLDLRYPGIVDECEAAMEAVMPRNRVGRTLKSGGYAKPQDDPSSVEVSAYSRSWPCLFPQHGPERKHERPIVLAEWQRDLIAKTPELLLRGLIHSDGCRFINTGTDWRCARYSFSNRSEDILGIFEAACALVGARCTRAPYTVYVSRKADVARLDEFIGPKR